MKRLLYNFPEFFEILPDRLRFQRWWVWMLFLAVTVFSLMGITGNTFDMTLDSWFSKDDPTRQAMNYFKDQFGSDEIIYLVYRPLDGDLFSKASLGAIIGIQEDILNFSENLSSEEKAMLSHVTKVESIASVKVLNAHNDTLVASRFISGGLPQTEKDRTDLRRKALLRKSFPLYYFSEGFEYGAIVIHTDLGTERLDTKEESTDFEETFDDFDTEMIVNEDANLEDKVPPNYRSVEMVEYSAMMAAINAIIQHPKYASLLEYHPVGNPPLMAYFMKQIEETGPLFIIMILVIVLLLWCLFHSLSAVVWCTLIVVISCIWTMGISGWFATTLTTMATLTIVLILAVGIADGVHIISGYCLYRRADMSHDAALRMVFRKAALPCLMTTLTTMVGMLSLTLSSIHHIRTFGYMSAIGVGFAFLITVFILPLMLDLRAPKVNSGKPERGRFFAGTTYMIGNILGRVLPFVEKRPMFIVSLFMVIFLACAAGATRVRIDSNLVECFKKGSELRVNYNIVDKHMAGTNTMEVFIDGGSIDSLLDPQIIMAMDVLQRTIETKYTHLVARTFSLVDIVKDAYQVINEGDEAFYRVPESSELLTQTLFMFNNAAPEDRRKIVSDNYRKTHISVQLYNAGSYQYTSFFNAVRKDIDHAFADIRKNNPDFKADVTGSLALIMRLADYIGWSQVKSLGTVTAIISLIMVFIFGSIQVGGLSIVPNLIPATLIFGLLGCLGIALDSDTIIIAPVIIGIAVDDTIHFITHYRDDVIRHGDVFRSIRNTIQEVGQAITFTSLILGFGFLTLAFSSNTSFIKVGILGALAIFAALVCDLLLLPALILVFKPKFSKREWKNMQVNTEKVP